MFVKRKHKTGSCTCNFTLSSGALSGRIKGIQSQIEWNGGAFLKADYGELNMRANILQKSRNKGATDVSAIEKDTWICMRLKEKERDARSQTTATVRYWKMQSEGLVKLKTRVKALAEFRRWEDGLYKSRREKNKEKTICRPRRICATFVDLISAHHERQLTSAVTWSEIAIVLSSLSSTL